MSKLSKIISDLRHNIVTDAVAGMIRDGDGHMKAAEKSDKFEQEALAAIKQLMLDLVGEDREYGSNDLPVVIEQIKTENRVHAELRTKIEAL